MASRLICDGTVVEYEPCYEDEDCDECGHHTGRRIANEPRFHGGTVRRDGKWFCSRCGEQFVGLAEANEITKALLVPAIIAGMAHTSSLYKYFKGAKHG
jgi:ribosomal protein L37AE/L43A